MKLTDIVRSGSSMLSYTMAVMVTTPFAYEVIAAYNLTMFIIQSIRLGHAEDTLEAFSTAVLFFFYATLLYMFCNSGHYMTVKVRNYHCITTVLFIFYALEVTCCIKVKQHYRQLLVCRGGVADRRGRRQKGRALISKASDSGFKSKHDNF